MKYNEELKKGDIVEIINTHKNQSGYKAKFVVTGFIEYWGYKKPRIFVEAVMIDGEYKDWNGKCGKQEDIYHTIDGKIFTFGKRALRLVHKGV